LRAIRSSTSNRCFLELIPSALKHLARAVNQPLSLLLCPILTIHLQSQTKIDSVRKVKTRYIILSWSTGMLFINKKPGNFAISFPYYSSNLPSPGLFKGTLGNPFTQDLLLQDLFSFEFLSIHHSIDFHIGLITCAKGSIGPSRPYGSSPLSIREG